MRFSIVSQRSGLSLGEYDETAHAIRLVEGRPIDPSWKRPLYLAPGERTTVAYPLDGPKGEDGPPRLVCVVERLDGREAVPRLEEHPGTFTSIVTGIEPKLSLVEAPKDPAPIVRRRRVARPS